MQKSEETREAADDKNVFKVRSTFNEPYIFCIIPPNLEIENKNKWSTFVQRLIIQYYLQKIRIR